MGTSREELLIAVIARLLEGSSHVAVGMASPIPGSAALLARALSGGDMRVSIHNSESLQSWTDGGVEIFDCAAQGRIDAFFLSGGQIDGQANVNLVGIGGYPRTKVRWSGSFGSAYLYFLIPRVILFREEHSRRALVERVDFISAPGTSEPKAYRPGGPRALVTGLCVFDFDQARKGFRLASIHPGHGLEEVLDNTGFAFEVPAHVAETPVPDAAMLELVRGEIAAEIAEPYPSFASRVFGRAGAAASAGVQR